MSTSPLSTQPERRSAVVIFSYINPFSKSQLGFTFPFPNLFDILRGAIDQNHSINTDHNFREC